MKKVVIVGCGMLVLSGCGSHKKTVERNAAVTVVKSEMKGVQAMNVTETTRYGDTLKGSVPLVELTEVPVTYNVESGGTELEITATKGKLTYKVIPKAVETKKVTQKKDEISTNAIRANSVVQDRSTSKRKQWRPPWWTYFMFLLIGLAVGTFFSKPIKTFLKPFKILLK